MNNPPAFPNNGNRFDGRIAEGMTLRDWFAGQALAGILPVCARDTPTPDETPTQAFARKAYDLADAMLAERAK